MIQYKKIKKGDTVKVIAGKEKAAGKTGTVLKVDREKGRVLVEGVNFVKKAIRKTQQNQVGGLKEVEAFLNISNVMLVCPKCKATTRVGFKVVNDKKVRFCKKCKADI